jgi:hypothetical protein
VADADASRSADDDASRRAGVAIRNPKDAEGLGDVRSTLHRSRESENVVVNGRSSTPNRNTCDIVGGDTEDDEDVTVVGERIRHALPQQTGMAVLERLRGAAAPRRASGCD